MQAESAFAVRACHEVFDLPLETWARRKIRSPKDTRMRIECPSCQTIYEVPDALIGPAPKMMRCARCAREWTVTAPGFVPEPVVFAPVVIPPLPEPPSFTEPSPDLDPPHPAVVARPQSNPVEHGIMLGWLLSLLVIAALLVAIYFFRDAIVAAWPPSQRLFHGLGLR